MAGFSADVLGIRADQIPECVLFWQLEVKFFLTAWDHTAHSSP